jgi:hypothetical protein
MMFVRPAGDSFFVEHENSLPGDCERRVHDYPGSENTCGSVAEAMDRAKFMS